MNKIDSRAIIGKEVKFGENIEIEAFASITGKVEIRDGTRIGQGAIIKGPATIGINNNIYPYATIGFEPQDYAFKESENSGVVIGNNNIIREFTTIHRATGADAITEVGNNNLIMAYAHLAHNVRVGSNTIIVNGAQLGGYVEVEDYAYISSLVAIHQFSRVGKYAIIGGVARVTRDILPFFMAVGVPVRMVGLNLVGLRRNKFGSDRINNIKKAFKIIYMQGLSIKSAMEKLADEFPSDPDIACIIEFVKKTKRGITKKYGTEE